MHTLIYLFLVVLLLVEMQPQPTYAPAWFITILQLIYSWPGLFADNENTRRWNRLTLPKLSLGGSAGYRVVVDRIWTYRGLTDVRPGEVPARVHDNKEVGPCLS